MNRAPTSPSYSPALGNGVIDYVSLDSLLAFGDSGFSEYDTGTTASYCLDGTTIVGRIYTETPDISVAGRGVPARSRTTAGAPALRRQIVNPTRHELVLRDLASGE